MIRYIPCQWLRAYTYAGSIVVAGYEQGSDEKRVCVEPLYVALMSVVINSAHIMCLSHIATDLP